MSKLLVIQAHPHMENSLSLTVGTEFVEAYRQAHPADQIIIRDLFTSAGVPALNNQTIAAWRKQKLNLPLDTAEQKLLNAHATWLAEFVAADKYVFINPMYNHFLPAELKQYIDLTAVAHQTFEYTANGPRGLLAGKKAMHIQAAGGYYHQSERPQQSAAGDLGDRYLTEMLAFYGITAVEKLFIEGADANPANRTTILEQALEQAASMAQTF